VAQVQALHAPSGEALARWIKTAVEEKGSSISPAAIGSLVDLVGNDLWTLAHELEKLSLYASGRTIQEADARELVSQVREASIFAAVDAILEGKPGIALPLLRQLRQDGREVSYIISMIQRQLRLLALARDLADRGVPQRELGSRLGLNSQFVLRKTLDQARRHSSSAINWQYHRLLEVDLAVKQGLMEPDLALELLVAEMASHR
jgi:DNA polymerase-3 subunit delta